MNNLTPPGNITATSMTLSTSMTFDDWTATGKTLGTIARAAAWWLGDWLHFGETQYGQKYTQATDVTGLDYQLLADYKWVASRVQFSLRNENLSWWHHRVVASLEPDEQKMWLDKALAGEWTTRQLALSMQCDDMNLDALADMEDVDLHTEVGTEPAWQLLLKLREDIDRARRFGVALNHFTEQDANIPRCGWPARLVYIEPEHIMRAYLAAMNNG